MEPIDALRAFRHSIYRCFDHRADALFELGDALLTAGVVPSPVHLSLQPSHRRGWGSLYAALRRGRIDAAALRRLLVRDPLAAAVAGGEAPVYAVDVSVWPRCDAECRAPNAASTTIPRATPPASPSWPGGPISGSLGSDSPARAGPPRWTWSACLPPRTPKRGRRRAGEGPARPVADRRGRAFVRLRRLLYDPVQVQQGLEGCRGQILVRLRAGRCFYADPVGPPAPTGRHRRHGRKFDCKDPASWPEPSAEHACEDAGYGKVRVRAWANLHPKVQAHAGRGSRGPTPIVVGTLVLVEVERLPGGERRREPRVLWLWWHALDGVAAAPDLGLLWRAYARRFDLEHTFRFLKQSMGWSTPRVRHPEQADRWTWLVLAAYTQLRLARSC